MKKKHSHDHSHSHGHSHSALDHGHHHMHHLGGCKGQSLKNIGWAFLLNLSFTIIEIVGGLLTQSVAVLSDAVHDAGDTISLGFAYFLEKKAAGGPTAQFSYGMKRLSLLSSVISGVVITLGSAIVLWEAIPRIWDPGEPKGAGMMGLAVLGIAMNGFAALRLKHGATQNEKVLTWHLLEDALGWASVLVGGALVYFFKWNWIDPLLAVLISLWIVRNVLGLLFKSISLFLQATPDPEQKVQFTKALEKVEGLQSFHDLHLWSLDGESHVLSVHLVTSLRDGPLLKLKNHVREISTSILGHVHTTIEIEYPGEDCPDNCDVSGHQL